jgi:Fe-S-cluster containining protein
MTHRIEQLESLCQSCVGACCRGSWLVLDSSEAEHLRVGGTKLSVVMAEFVLRDLIDSRKTIDLRLEALKALYKTTPADDPLREKIFSTASIIFELDKDQEYYEMSGSCGYLDENGRCSSYEDRPTICREFEPGESACMNFRHKAGIEPTTVQLPNPTLKRCK